MLFGWADRLCAILFALAIGVHVQAYAQTPQDNASVAAAPDLTTDRIKAKIQEIEARKDLDAATLARTLAEYGKALAALESVEASNKAAEAAQKSLQTAPNDTAAAKRALDKLLSSSGAELAQLSSKINQIALDDVNRQLDAARGELAKVQTELGQLDGTLRDMASRATEARAEQLDYQKKLDQLSDISTSVDSGAPAALVDAQRTAVTAERLARSAKINLLEQDIIGLPARQALVSARHDLAAARLDVLRKKIGIYETRANELRKNADIVRKEEAERTAEKLSDDHPVLQTFAKDTSEIVDKQAELTKSIADAQSSETAAAAEIAGVKDSLTSAQQILEIGSVGSDLGEYLRSIRSQLPVLSALREKIRANEEAIVQARLRRLDIEQRRRSLLEPTIAERIVAAADLGPEENKAYLAEQLSPLIGARRDALEQTSGSLDLLIERFAALNSSYRELESQTVRLQALLNNRLLWLPGPANFGALWWEHIIVGVKWIGNPESWMRTAVTLGNRAYDALLPTSVFAVIFVALLVGRRKLVGHLPVIEGDVGKISADNFMLTPRAVIITLLVALPVPLLLFYGGWLLRDPQASSEFSTAVGRAAIAVAAVLLTLRFASALCRPFGVLMGHFHWSERHCKALQRNLARITLVLAPIVFVQAMIEASSSQIYRDGLGRAAFLAGAAATAMLFFRILHPRNGPLTARLSADGTLRHSRSAWFPALVAVPLALGAMATVGYYDSAIQVAIHLSLTVVLVLVSLVAHGIGVREVLVARRRIEIARARERRKASTAKVAAASDQDGRAGPTPAVEELDTVDVASISEQTRSLLSMTTLIVIAVGLWFIWRPLLPSLGLLDGVVLWMQTTTTETGTQATPITLFNLLAAIALGVVTFIAARNLPGLIEFTVLQRMSLAAGTRYAITSISRYCIIAIGTVIAFRSLGADWSQLQWIVAALSVGVGFGLQEIVANFISGLIILFERPVRVGDIVTIGEKSGTVSRIQIRATSITDWDNKEVVIPNKSLITDQVTNWTLTESIIRLQFEVGVAYGTRSEYARDVIMQAVRSTSLVLVNPPPNVWFLGFGDSSINFTVQAFIAQPAHTHPVLHGLHSSIYGALGDHGIEIPFPQRDLHLKLGGQPITEELILRHQVAGDT